MITVDGKKYRVTENLGFQGGYYAKVVATDTGERVAVKRGGQWTWWKVQDRLRPGGQYVGQTPEAHDE